jgi:hypothetical protein
LHNVAAVRPRRRLRCLATSERGEAFKVSTPISRTLFLTNLHTLSSQWYQTLDLTPRFGRRNLLPHEEI